MTHFAPGEIITHTEICLFEGFTVQQGMNFHTGRGGISVLLMSVAKNAPYNDSVEEVGKTVIYEGHDVRKDLVNGPSKNYDQPLSLPSGRPTSNGKFFAAAKAEEKESVRLYEKIKPGIWVYNGSFMLRDAWVESDGRRNVVKYRLDVLDSQPEASSDITYSNSSLIQTRMIPSNVKFEVYKRDNGQCVLCGSSENLHYDHELPYSRGGTSLSANNIRLLCMKHNLQKSNKIE